MTPAEIRWHDAVGSTQDSAHQLAESGAAHGTTVAARVQTAGRGTRRRAWVSSEGGLWLSVVCRPREIVYLETLSLRVGLALAALLDRWLGSAARVAIKWPNDLFLGDRKVGGILTEARWQGEVLGWVVAGVGINLRNPLPEQSEPRAARLADFGMRQAPEELAPVVAHAVAEATRTGTPLTSQEIRGFDARDWLRGRRLSLPHEGTALGISETGRLRIQKPDGTVIETLGTVALAEPPG